GEKITRERLAQSDGLAREVNFTQTDDLPFDNKITDGEWWQDAVNPDEAQISMEEEVAGEIGVSVGDLIDFSIGGISISARLTSIRSVNWQSMTPNFYVIFSDGALNRFSPNWLAGVRDINQSASRDSVVSREASFVPSMVKQFPTAVVLPLADVINRVSSLIDRVTRGLEMILLLVLACGALVLFAAIAVTFDERLRENAILRTLGSSQKVVFGSLATEFAVLGLIAGLIASIGAEVVLFFMQTQVFNMTPELHPSLWLLGTVSGVLVISFLGLLRCRTILSVPPLQSLRQLG
ncbi:MAG: FtsX-like permease family protein, partial [Pseudomonadota bacterium]